jgi:hypothetical protein
MAQQQRMLFVDNLRLGIIILVVGVHVAVTYSGLGSWYYKEHLPLDPASFLFFAVSQLFVQAFFMGTLFMIAGYYAAASFKSKGRALFLKGRCIRLGIPTLFYMMVINPLTVYYLMDWDHTKITVPFADFYVHYVTSLAFLGGTGPMWFALALLLFCVVYALSRPATTTPGPGPETRRLPPGLPLLLALAASLGAFLLRLKWPIGTNVGNMQLCFFSQYIVLFCFGIAAHGRDWLSGIDYALGRRCLAAAFLGVPLLVGLIFLSGSFGGDPTFRGGWNWASAAFAVWESFTGVYMSVGLVGVLRHRWNSQGPLVKSMSASAFAVYVFHPPILVCISQLLRPVLLPAVPKFLLVFAVSVPVCFVAARLIRATPLLRDMVRS